MMLVRQSTARCCCSTAGTSWVFGRTGDVGGKYSALPELQTFPTYASDAYKYNGSCASSVMDVNTFYTTALGVDGSDKWGIRTTMAAFESGPATTSPFPTLEAGMTGSVRVGYEGTFGSEADQGVVEISLLKPTATSGFCAIGAGEKYTNTITHAIARNPALVPNPFRREWGIPIFDVSDLVAGEMDISDLLDEVRTSAEYIADPDFIPVWEMRPSTPFDDGIIWTESDQFASSWEVGEFGTPFIETRNLIIPLTIVIHSS